MTPTLDLALTDLHRALAAPDPVRADHWQRQVLRALARAGEALDPVPATRESWLAGRAGHLAHERERLRGRLAVASDTVVTDGPTAHAGLCRLATDLEHHRQRISDLAYDEVELELGGEE